VWSKEREGIVKETRPKKGGKKVGSKERARDLARLGSVCGWKGGAGHERGGMAVG